MAVLFLANVRRQPPSVSEVGWMNWFGHFRFRMPEGTLSAEIPANV
jgi:hypothetical protein